MAHQKITHFISMDGYFHGYNIKEMQGSSKEVNFTLFNTTLLGSAILQIEKKLNMEYVGEVDINGKACGYGIAFSEDRSVKYGGTFWEGQVHGICKL